MFNNCQETDIVRALCLLLTSVFHQGFSFVVVGLQYIIISPREISSPCSFGRYPLNQFFRHTDSVSLMYKPHQIHLDHNVTVVQIVNVQNTRRNINIEKFNRTNLKKPQNSQVYIGPCSQVFIWGTVSPPCGIQGDCPWKIWLFNQFQIFKQYFHASLIES